VAVAIAREHVVTMPTIRTWSENEGFVPQFEEFERAVKNV
jgi:hypothetical protein